MAGIAIEFNAKTAAFEAAVQKVTSDVKRLGETTAGLEIAPKIDAAGGMGKAQAAMAEWRKETGLSASTSMDWAAKQREGAQAAELMAGKVGKTASGFKPATQAMRDYSLRAEETGAKTAKSGKQIEEASSHVGLFGQAMGAARGQIAGLGQDLVGFGLAAAGIGTVFNTLKDTWNMGVSAESGRLQLKAIINDADKTTKALAGIAEAANSTVRTKGEVRGVAKELLETGMDPEKAVQMAKALSGTAHVMGESYENMGEMIARMEMKGDEGLISGRQFLSFATKLNPEMAQLGKEYAAADFKLSEYNREQENANRIHKQGVEDQAIVRETQHRTEDEAREDSQLEKDRKKEDSRLAATYEREDARRSVDQRTRATETLASAGTIEKKAYQNLKSEYGTGSSDKEQLKHWSERRMLEGARELSSLSKMSIGAAIQAGPGALMAAADEADQRKRAEQDQERERKEKAADTSEGRGLVDTGTDRQRTRAAEEREKKAAELAYDRGFEEGLRNAAQSTIEFKRSAIGKLEAALMPAPDTPEKKRADAQMQEWRDSMEGLEAQKKVDLLSAQGTAGLAAVQNAEAWGKRIKTGGQAWAETNQRNVLADSGYTEDEQGNAIPNATAEQRAAYRERINQGSPKPLEMGPGALGHMDPSRNIQTHIKPTGIPLENVGQPQAATGKSSNADLIPHLVDVAKNTKALHDLMREVFA